MYIEIDDRFWNEEIINLDYGNFTELEIGYFRKDDDRHWYLIPEQEIDNFDADYDYMCSLGDKSPEEIGEREGTEQIFDLHYAEYRIDHPFDCRVIIED